MADDVFQATFLRLHHARDRYDPAYPFLPWLFTICRNAIVDDARRRARIRGREVDDDAALAQAQAPTPAPDQPAAELPSLDALPQAQREALHMRYTAELPFDEIARRLETSNVNARQLVSRALRRLKGGAR